MGLKGKWQDKINNVDYIVAEDINDIANSVIELEDKIEGGNSSAVLLVTAQQNTSTHEWTVDKTFAEITEAVKKGTAILQVTHDSVTEYYYSSLVEPTVITFCSYDVDGEQIFQNLFIIDSTNEVYQQTVASGAGVKIIDIISNDGYTSETTWQELIDSVNANKYIVARFSDMMLPISAVSPNDVNVTFQAVSNGNLVCFEAKQGTAGSIAFTLTQTRVIPQKGVDYWTEADKQEINNYIADELAKRGQLKPEFANSIEELKESGDTSKLYVLPDGYIYAYMYAYTTETVTEKIVGTSDNPYEQGRLSSGAANGLAGYITTPYIDLTKYSLPFVIHLKGIPFVYSNDGNRRYSTYINDKAHLKTNFTSISSFLTEFSTMVLTEEENETCSISCNPPITDKSTNAITSIRFSGKGTEASANVYITYEHASKKEDWNNTGLSFVAGEDIITETSFEIANKSVRDFIEQTSYTDDYSTTNITNFVHSDYFRKDIPLTARIAWKPEANAVRYSVAVNSLAGVLNTGMKLYYTTETSFSFFNSTPSENLYYKVHAIMADGEIKLIKEGSIEISDFPTRMIDIDGIQNVRDIGGWRGLDNATVRHSRIYRGSALDELIRKNLSISEKGKKTFLDELQILVDFDLRGKNNVTSSILGSNVEFYSPTYSYGNYTTAITDGTYQMMFKEMFEKLTTFLSENKAVYIHCSGGCDRTGTFVFLLLGLLGVSESDLAKEYELSSFSTIGHGRERNSTVYDYKGMVSAIKGLSGNALVDKFYTFATTCGISAETISQFKQYMLL